jgi:hypothetical protein
MMTCGSVVLQCRRRRVHLQTGASEPAALAIEEARGTHAPGPGQRKPRTPPTDASHAAGRVGGGRSSCGARRSRAGIGARQQPLWVTHTHQAGRRRWQGARRVETRWPGAARGDNRAIVASPGSARMPSPTSPCNALTLPFATVPVGAALETPAASNCVQRRARWRASPVGNAKTHSTPSHDDGVEHKWWLPSPPPPPPPWASSRRPRHHIRRRLRRAARCVGAFAAAPAQDARALRAIDPCCAGTSWPD